MFLWLSLSTAVNSANHVEHAFHVVADLRNLSSISLSIRKQDGKYFKKHGWHKVLGCRVLSILFCILFSNILGNGKHVAAWNFTRPHIILCGREFRFLIHCYFFHCSHKMILQNDFELQKRARVFLLVLKIQLFSNNLNTNKILMAFFLYRFPWIFLATK